MKTIIFCTLLTAFSGPSLLFSQTAPDRREIDELDRQYESFFHDRNAQGIAGLFVPNAIWTDYSGSAQVKNAAEIEKSQAKGFGTFKSAELKIVAEEYGVLPGGYLLATGTFAAKGTIAADGSPFSFNGRYLNLYKKEKGHLKIQALISSPAKMAQAPTADAKAIRDLCLAETQSYLNGDKTAENACWKLDDATRLLASYNNEVYYGDVAILEQGVSQPTQGQAFNGNFNIRISGDMGFATFDQIQSHPDGKFSVSRELRCLEKVGGKWKIAVVSAHGITPD